jgi:tyrosine-protein phosphatase SIW14
MVARSTLPGLALCAALMAVPPLSAQSSPSAPTPIVGQAYGERLALPGVHNAGKISGSLYRGAQPHAESFEQLKALGVTTIVDLRGEDRQKADWERSEAGRLGMRFVRIPVNGWSPPSDEQVAQFLSLFHGDPPQPIFVHCRLGEDRTGVFIATYRMAVDKWSPKQALGEMYFFGFNGFWHPAMKRFIREFPAHVRNSAPLAALRAVQQATP